eukprot:6695762-Prymnesium_polylepis.1
MRSDTSARIVLSVPHGENIAWLSPSRRAPGATKLASASSLPPSLSFTRSAREICALNSSSEGGASPESATKALRESRMR